MTVSVGARTQRSWGSRVPDLSDLSDLVEQAQQPRPFEQIRADIAELAEPHATLAKAETYDRLLNDVAPLLAEALAANRALAEQLKSAKVAEALSQTPARRELAIARQELAGLQAQSHTLNTALDAMTVRSNRAESELAGLRADNTALRQHLAELRTLAEAGKVATPNAPYTGVSWQRMLDVLDGSGGCPFLGCDQPNGHGHIWPPVTDDGGTL